ncbi:MAG: CPBP family intramembrane glutamic endopeptidase [Terracidiphilus sp.]
MSSAPEPARATQSPNPGPGVLEWVFLGPHGLRTGWSVLFAYCLFRLFRMVVVTFFVSANLVDESSGFTAATELTLELIPFTAMLGAGVFAALIEQRRMVDFNLTGPRRPLYFVSGLAAGFAALSALIGALHWGGWLRIGPAAFSGAQMVYDAALWGLAFLAVGCVEEGLFRCYLQSTLTRGIDFWWALAAEIGLCLYLFLHPQNNGAWGVYAIALLGLLPCLALHLRSAARSAFWQAAWVTSTGFGLIHTFNGGENWTGIFAAASIGFVFCVSVRVTGSAWWAIGCHAAWDWAETYFYGAADSGLQARGHFLASSPVGNPLLSGGSDGPEGSLLALGSILLLFALLVIMQRGGKSAASPAA